MEFQRRALSVDGAGWQAEAAFTQFPKSNQNIALKTLVYLKLR